MSNDVTESPAGVNVRAVLAAAAPPLALAIIGALLCYWAAGASLGLFFGGIGLGTVLIPPLALTRRGGLSRRLNWIALAAVVDGIGAVWLVPVIGGIITLGQWLGCYVLLGAYLMSLAAMAGVLRCLRLPVLGASAITTLAGLVCLTWPLWLAPWLHGSSGEHLAGWLVPAHPLFAVNAVLQHPLGVWTQQPLMYQWITLGQDIPYQLPHGAGPAIGVHLLLSLILLGLAEALPARWAGPQR